ncbi:MAG: DUF305 domain-containing protein [Gemmatimonadaceae bacterium]|nr:DUF305 domain-containing protein [Gemmatimonadaceae bacterium]
MTFRITMVAGALLLAATGGCSGSPRATAPVEPVRTGPVHAQGQAAAILRARADSARLPYTAADIRFMTHMIPHHAQALEMAKLVPSHGASATVRTLAGRILSGQQDEIATMQQWLRDRQQPVPDAAAGGLHAGHGAGQEHTMMPGMLTHEQMTRLDAARGWDFDRLFLTFMIQHHRGAVGMVDELFSTHGAAQDETIFKFASDVQVDQRTEIARMERMLADVLAAPDSP